MRGGESVCNRHEILRSARAMPTFVALDDVFIGKGVEEKQSSEKNNQVNPLILAIMVQTFFHAQDCENARVRGSSGKPEARWDLCVGRTCSE
jgi:hypothetical protein